jgi:hypothetical protein
MPWRAMLLAILVGTAACDLCSDGARKCDELGLEECRNGDWVLFACTDGGVVTYCFPTPDGGAECT